MLLRTLIVPNRLGAIVQSARAALSLHRAVHSRLESVGTEANDELARWLLERLCPPGGTFLDVGAHIGSVLAGVRRHSNPARLIAIEAMPDKVANLRRRFPHVEVHEFAVGAQAGEASFFVDLAQSGYSSLTAREGAGTREIRVKVVPLDEALAGVAVDVMKIDVEGAELAALRGAAALVDTGRPVIMFESATLTLDAGAIWAWFDERDYDVVLPNRVAHLGPPLSREGFEEAHIYPRRTMNYFALPREKRSVIRDRARALLGIVATD